MSENHLADDWVTNTEAIDLAAIFSMLWARRLWVVASVVMCTTVATIYAFAATPIYRASVVMVPADTGRGGSLDAVLGQFSGLASLAGIQVGAGSVAKEEALAVLRSREFTEAFIHERNLMPVLFPKRWDSEGRRWKRGRKPPTSAEAYKFFRENVCTVSDDKKTSLVRLQIDWRDRVLAATWANDLVQRLNTEMQARAISSAEASVGYLETELQATTTVATREAINRLIEAQIKQRMLANVTREYSFRVVDKAMVPDENDPIRPRRILALAGGVVGGGVLGVMIVLAVGMARSNLNSQTTGRHAGSQSGN